MNAKALVVALVLCFALCGCVGVTPMRQRVVAQQGPTAKIDLAFLKPGTTTRAEVLDKLKATNTGFQSDHFFVGRWRASKWAAWIAIGTPAGYGGFGGDRIWHNTNLLVEFDENGVVKRYEIFPDKLFLAEVAPVAHERKLAAGEPAEVSVLVNGEEIPVNLVLSSTSVEIEELSHSRGLRHRPQYHYTVPSRELQDVTLHRYQENVGYFDVTLRFETDLRQFHGPRGRKVSVQMTVPQLITVLAYASAHSPGTSGPEAGQRKH